MAAEPDPPPWRVLTWNVRGSARPPLGDLAEVIRGYAPDVVAIQEIQRAQARRLADLLGWAHVWGAKHYPWTPLAWWLAEGHAILTPFGVDGRRRESIAPGVSSWTYRHRVVLAATVTRADTVLRMYCTHLASGRRATDERIAQAGRVVDRVLADAAPLRVVAGDLNTHRGEVEVLREFHRAGLRDPGGGGPTCPSSAPRERLDHVLVPDRAVVVEQHEPDGGDHWVPLSDHVPTMVAFRLPGTSGEVN